MADEIDTYKLEDPFANSVPIKGICQMHAIGSNGKTKHLWLNSKHEKSDNKSQISLGNTSAESVVAEVATLTKIPPNLVATMLLKLLGATSLVFMLL